jgi:hypothetical protein
MNKELLKKWLEALRIGYESSYEAAACFHRTFAGYKEKEHQQYDADVSQIKAAIDEIEAEIAKPESEQFEIDWPEYHDEGMGCGLEDRNITDRYDAMRYGWDEAIDSVARCIPDELYTSPRPMHRMTDEEIAYAHDQIGRDQSNVGLAEFISGARFAESAHNQG